MSDRLVIGFDTSAKDKSCLVVTRKEGRGLRVLNELTGSEAEELYDRLTEKQENGLLNRTMYRNDCFSFDEVELFKKIEKALGYKLFRWQKTFILIGAFRQYGETTAKCLRELLAVKEPPLDYSEAKGIRWDIYKRELRDIQEKLTLAGIPTRKVFYSREDKRRDGTNSGMVFVDELAHGSSPQEGANRVGTNVPTQPSVPPMPVVTQSTYLLGKDSGLTFDTGYVPEGYRYFGDTAEIWEIDNHIAMYVYLGNEKKKTIFMSEEQAKIIIELLQKQIDSLGGNK